MTPEKARSADPKDFQDLPQSIGAMSKNFADGFEIALHDHARDQLLYAKTGIMRLQTENDAWVVPSARAIYIPAGTPHAVNIHGDVDMRTLYINADATDQRPHALCVIAVSNLLRELILSLSEEPIEYDRNSRAGRIAQLIEIEIQDAREMSLNVPLPKDARLQRVCAELLANPSDRRTLEGWSEVSGASTRTLARLFERDLGMSFNQWRQRMRFHNALEALSNGDAISKVAHQHGYRSACAFSAAFTKVIGTPPSKVSING
ncbi:MAG: helix-turn-helix transcriptional regulator [Rhodospirillales bacterium]|jgi:AraC-like DNA-binding protein